jgi:hypothetical protein
MTVNLNYLYLDPLSDTKNFTYFMSIDPMSQRNKAVNLTVYLSQTPETK